MTIEKQKGGIKRRYQTIRFENTTQYPTKIQDLTKKIFNIWSKPYW